MHSAGPGPARRRRTFTAVRRACAWLCLAAGGLALWSGHAAEEPAQAEPSAAPAAPPVPAAAPASSTATPAAPPAAKPNRAYIVSIDGPVVEDFALLLGEALDAAPAGAPVVLELRLRGGDPAAAVKMLEAAADRRTRGPVLAYVREATGPGVLLLAAADRIYTRANAPLGPGASADATGLPLTLDRLEKLAAPAPYRVELERAFFENQFSLILGDTTIKKSGVPLTLTGTEAARQFGQPPQPLLANAVVAGADEALRDYFAGQPFEALNYAANGYVARATPAAEPAPAVAAAPAGATAPATVEAPSGPVAAVVAAPPADSGQKLASVYVVPIQGEIASPQLYILRRALKEAIENKIQTVVLDMDTLGGDLGTTLEMMEALAKFEGRTITFVNDKAMSAGSYIAIVTDVVYFTQTGTIGAAEAVTGSGENIDDSMQRKVESFMRARVRVLAGAGRYRADVQRAMMDPDFEFKIGAAVINPKGKLLTLTAAEACESYGDPPEALLGAGIAPDVAALLTLLYGKDGYTIKDFHLTWSERAAKWLIAISPILMAVGLLLLVIEFKTPGFGVIGFTGIGLLLLVFASHYLAGLAGYEPVALFALGLMLIALELFVFTGTLAAGVLGVLCLFVSLLWAMTDVWPVEGFGLTPNSFTEPLLNISLALVLALGGFGLVARFLPKSWIFQKLVNEAVVPRDDLAATSGAAPATGATTLPPAGTHGVAVTDLRPLGEIEIAGGRYQARALHGQIDRGAAVVVIGRKDFALAVKLAD